MESGNSPTTVFGVTLCNNQTFLREALESLLNQTRRDFVVVMLDDCPNVESRAIAEEFVKRDDRFRYHTNTMRMGMIATWRQVYFLAKADFPDMKYFAWASDHDLWHPEWLAKLAGVLDQDPDAVMAYPLAQRIDEHGQDISHNVRKGVFSTQGLTQTCLRFRSVTRLRRNFGNMVYGLYCANALEKAGVYRDTFVPDRLLMQELSLQGLLLQVEAVLWKRRFRKTVTLQTQARSLWAGNRPLSTHLPWEWVHTGYVFLALYRHMNRHSPTLDLLRMAAEQVGFATRSVFQRCFPRR